MNDGGEKIHPHLTPEALAQIYEHARRDYPRECCGIVFGAADRPSADVVKPCLNMQDELHAADPALHPRDSTTAYNLGAGDLFVLQKSLRGDAPAKIVYHSHVEVGAYFSPMDQAAALMGDEPAYPVEYVVVDIRADGPHGAAQFAWDETRRSYLEVRRYGVPTDDE
jgi:proteasome lid subunit RPN8/RPN11